MLALLGGCYSVRWQSLSEQRLRNQIQVLAGTSWRAEAIDGDTVLKEIQSTIQFEVNARIAGNTGCGLYMSEASVRGRSIRFGTIMTAEAPCPTEFLKQEERYVRALMATRGMRIEEDRLALLDDHGTVILLMKRLPDLRGS